MGRDIQKVSARTVALVSIHAPRMGRDAKVGLPTRSAVFQFTRPAWGATKRNHQCDPRVPVSIHAPRMGRDRQPRQQGPAACQFQFTRPAWGATRIIGDHPENVCFNSRAPHGARPRRDLPYLRQNRFNSRAPHGARRALRGCPEFLTGFNSRAPHGARPGSPGENGEGVYVSIHAPRMGRDFAC